MKKLIALACCGFAIPAAAQSNVTVYGLIDAGLAHIDNKNGASSNEVRSGSLYSSRLGFRGSEDLGNGLKAIFNLEAGLNVDTANSPVSFNRASYVGLQSNSLGTIMVGRMLPTINDIFIQSINASYFGNPAAALDGAALNQGSSVARFNNMLGGIRMNNVVKYQSPKMSGFQLHAMTGLGEEPGTNGVPWATSAGRTLSLGGNYASDSFEAGLAYHETECKRVGGCTAAQGTDKIIGAGLAYKHNGARYAAFVTRQQNALNVRDNDADVFSLIGRIPFKQWVFSAGAQFLNDRSKLNQDARQLNFAVNYLLSKRTQLYTMYSRQSVSNNGKAGMYSTVSSDDRQGQISAGLVHMF